MGTNGISLIEINHSSLIEINYSSLIGINGIYQLSIINWKTSFFLVRLSRVCLIACACFSRVPALAWFFTVHCQLSIVNYQLNFYFLYTPSSTSRTNPCPILRVMRAFVVWGVTAQTFPTRFASSRVKAHDTQAHTNRHTRSGTHNQAHALSGARTHVKSIRQR